jgi:replication factor A1
MVIANNDELKQIYSLISDKISPEEFEQQLGNLEQEMGGLIEKTAVSYMILSRYDRLPVELAKLKERNPGETISANVKVTTIEPKREFLRKDGKPGSVITLNVEDQTGKCRLILWDSKLQDLVEENKIIEGTELLVINAKFKEGMYGSELSPGKKSEIVILDEEDRKFWDWLMARGHATKSKNAESEILDIKDLYDDVEYARVDVKGTVKETGTLREFTRKNGTKGYVINYRIYDGTGEAVVTLWDSHAQENRNIKIGNILTVHNGRPKEREGNIEIHTSYTTKLIID